MIVDADYKPDYNSHWIVCKLNGKFVEQYKVIDCWVHKKLPKVFDSEEEAKYVAEYLNSLM
jgi:hypothetical protein